MYKESLGDHKGWPGVRIGTSTLGGCCSLWGKMLKTESNPLKNHLLWNFALGDQMKAPDLT